jgi:hypothetical protein
MIHDDFRNDERITKTAEGVGVFIAEHLDAVPLGRILTSFRDPDADLALALDELEALDYVRRIVGCANPTEWDVFYLPNPATLGGVTA